MNGSFILAGVAGWPVTQSLSPLLHSHWLAEHKIEGAYLPLPVKRENLGAALEGLRLTGFTGVNLTVPHKEAGLALATRADALARAAGAANLLRFRSDGGIEARNTDVLGLMASLAEAGLALQGCHAVILGAGGAARAAVLALDRMGAATVSVLNRDGRRAAILVAGLKDELKAQIRSAALSQWPGIAGDVALVLNATKAGMIGEPALDVNLEPLPQAAHVCDLVYNPLETDLLKRARARGLAIIDGLGMLIHQAVPAFAAFYGVTPTVTARTRALLETALRK